MRSLLLVMVASTALAQGFDGPGVTRGDLLKQRQYRSAGALSLFVDSTGNDGNGCMASGTAACLTIQGALNKLPKLLRGPTLVTVGAGSFAGAFIDGFDFINDLNAPSTGAYLEIDGTLANFVPATGTATGTATAGSAGTTSPIVFGTLTDGGQTWTVNDLRGRLIRITGGTGSGQVFPIKSNTGTVITISGTWTAPTGTSTYVISDWGTTITPGVVRPALSQDNAVGAVQAGFRVGANGLAQEQMNFKNLKFTTANALDIRSDGLVFSRNNRFETTSTVFVLGGSGQLTVQGNSVLIATSATGFSVSVGTKFVNSLNNLYRGATATGNSAVNVATSSGTFQIEAIENLANGVAISTPGWTFTNVIFDTITGVCADANGSVGGINILSRGSMNVSSSSFLTCGTAVRAAGGSVVSAVSTVGSASTIALEVDQGAMIQISSGTTTTGTTEISIDGTAYTLAALRALTPKQIVDLGTLSRIVER